MKTAKDTTENWAMLVNTNTVKGIIAAWVVVVGLILGGAAWYLSDTPDQNTAVTIQMVEEGKPGPTPDTEYLPTDPKKAAGAEASGPDSVMRQGE